MHPQDLNTYSDADFKRLTGFSRKIFEQMLVILGKYDAAHRSLAGRKSDISLENQLLITLLYWKHYNSYQFLGHFWGLHESSIYRIIQKTERILRDSQQFDLPEQVLTSPDEERTFLTDSTEISIQRPLQNQSESYSGKKKDTPINFKSSSVN